MEKEITDVFLPLILLHRSQLEHINDLEATISALKTVVVRLAGPSVATTLAELEHRYAQGQEDRKDFQSIDAMISMLQNGKSFDSADS